MPLDRTKLSAIADGAQRLAARMDALEAYPRGRDPAMEGRVAAGYRGATPAEQAAIAAGKYNVKEPKTKSDSNHLVSNGKGPSTGITNSLLDVKEAREQVRLGKELGAIQSKENTEKEALDRAYYEQRRAGIK